MIDFPESIDFNKSTGFRSGIPSKSEESSDFKHKMMALFTCVVCNLFSAGAPTCKSQTIPYRAYWKPSNCEVEVGNGIQGYLFVHLFSITFGNIFDSSHLQAP